MGIKDDKVKYVARLARLKLTDDEVSLIAKQLDGILGYVDKLKERLDISKDTPPMSHPNAASNPFREDRVRASSPVESVLSNAPQKKGNFIKVPRIIEE
ncbi:MAG TPA: Asp-tRNA(Asn)/Glu-tRNA(Gln) amidotransferase subunit GatC [Candidatus Omnitrophota bacterium]|nr:Asp-tRNA(Asn)/Glu-tRNA(Gln) amidotransferase subunit GatC [Candidatus Omnitrophota bacterium]HPN66817.1 Asp-tRNA(Asn)/Glu-tRNA(Gln) amidotransferase subunit GatC [Candidatus Omnitrophota bacterium]HRZ67622.1 Asp-tRNA(Asn)/Glu-tRNA(Gln) amidotransferase subunit GatC [Candidatus Omnitrophota bacterium]